MPTEIPHQPANRLQIPIDDLGPPGTAGQLSVLAMMPNERRSDLERLGDTSNRHFKVTARLTKSPLPAGDINGQFDANDGNSYIHLSEGSILHRVECSSGIFDIKKNDQSEQSMVEFECEATSTNQARALFRRAVLPFLDYQAYLANCPLFITSIRIEDSKNISTVLDYISPYRQTTINPHMKPFDLDLAPIYALYRDAKNSHSDFYRFLCYHKILDGIFGVLRTKLRQRASKKGIQLSQRRDQIPNDPDIDPAFKSYVGKPIRKFLDEVMTPQFRNAVAHFISKDGSVLNLSSSTEIERYSSILYICELCVREAIENHEFHLTEIVSST
jgi:methylamine utilization protein MauJ